jgi:hypothetical protein
MTVSAVARDERCRRRRAVGIMYLLSSSRLAMSPPHITTRALDACGTVLVPAEIGCSAG